LRHNRSSRLASTEIFDFLGEHNQGNQLPGCPRRSLTGIFDFLDRATKYSAAELSPASPKKYDPGEKRVGPLPQPTHSHAHCEAFITL
jgi:hypothetical protein